MQYSVRNTAMWNCRWVQNDYGSTRERIWNKCHQKMRSQKKLQQQNAYISNNFCMPYEFTIQGDAIIFACFDEPQNSIFQFPLISIYIHIYIYYLYQWIPNKQSIGYKKKFPDSTWESCQKWGDTWFILGMSFWAKQIRQNKHKSNLKPIHIQISTHTIIFLLYNRDFGAQFWVTNTQTYLNILETFGMTNLVEVMYIR